MSSAILYFAIVAIWAGVLMPRWLRPSRSHRHRTEGDQPAETVTEFAQPAPEAMVTERELDPPSRAERRERAERRAGGRDEAAGGHPEADRREADRREAERRVDRKSVV